MVGRASEQHLQLRRVPLRGGLLIKEEVVHEKRSKRHHMGVLLC